MERQLTTRALDGDDLHIAVRELQIASKRAWMDCETDALLSVLNQGHEIRIEVWIRESDHGTRLENPDHYITTTTQET